MIFITSTTYNENTAYAEIIQEGIVEIDGFFGHIQLKLLQISGDSIGSIDTSEEIYLIKGQRYSLQVEANPYGIAVFNISNPKVYIDNMYESSLSGIYNNIANHTKSEGYVEFVAGESGVISDDGRVSSLVSFKGNTDTFNLPVEIESAFSYILNLRVDFVDDNDNTIETKVVGYNEKINSADAPEKEGYEFVGWKLENSDELYNFDSEVKDNMILKAVYKEKESIHLTPLTPAEEKKPLVPLTPPKEKHTLPLTPLVPSEEKNELPLTPLVPSEEKNTQPLIPLVEPKNKITQPLIPLQEPQSNKVQVEEPKKTPLETPKQQENSQLPNTTENSSNDNSSNNDVSENKIQEDERIEFPIEIDEEKVPLSRPVMQVSDEQEPDKNPIEIKEYKTPLSLPKTGSSSNLFGLLIGMFLTLFGIKKLKNR